MFTTAGYLERTVRMLAEKIEQTLGGNIRVANDNDHKTITIFFKKNEATVNAVQFQKVYSYEEFEKLATANLIVTDFVTAYQNAGKPKTEILAAAEVELNKVTKVEEVKAEKPKVIEPTKPKTTKTKKP